MIEIKTTTEEINNQGGLLLAGEIGKRIGLGQAWASLSGNAGDTLLYLYGEQVQGHTAYEGINKFCTGEYFKRAMNIERDISADVERLNLERLAGSSDIVVKGLDEANLRLLKRVTPTPIVVNRVSFPVVDGDTSPFDNSSSHKEGVSYTYKGFNGFQPMFFYVGTEGYILSSELRPGSQHCQKGTPEMIKETNAKLESLWPGKHFLYRLDSGNDAHDTIAAILHNNEQGVTTGHFLLIKRNLRQESKEKWLQFASTLPQADVERPRPGKTVWKGNTVIHPEGKEIPEGLHIVFEVIERTTDYKGEPYLIPDIEVNTWWANIVTPADTAIELYHRHGTMEQFHSELKTDMNMERLPSSKMAVNKIVFATACLAYNTLRLIGQTAIKSKAYPCKNEIPSRKRLGKVISDLIDIAGKFIKHARKCLYKICCNNPWQPVFMEIADAVNSW
jgi:hypothetical protein